jgi:tetratricopeptide (TPR) repeat protein
VGSFQELARGREQQGFVGRGGELARFRANFALPLTDPQRRFVFSIHGDGGVGKSTLLRQLREIAAQERAWCAAVDEQVIGVPETLQALAAQLSAQGAKLPAFHRTNDAYTDSRTAPGADSEGWAGLIAQGAVTAGTAAAHAVPGVGVVADAVNAQAVARQVDRMAGRGRRARAAQVSLDPVQALTAALVQDIGRLAGDRTLALFFDTFEQTSTILDPWLRALLEGRYGPLPQRLVVAVAGRAPLDPSTWSAFLGVLEDVPLSAFTEAEARQFLARRGVRDELTVREIINGTGGLPLLVAMRAQGGTHRGDLSGDAVDRMLSGLDPDQRRLASAAALARSVNEDTLAVLAQAAGQGGDGGSQFAWLCSREFVAHEAGVCRFHDLVRDPLITQARRQSPQRWHAVHTTLAEHFATAHGSLPDAWEDEHSRGALLEEWYHRLCADPRLTPHVLETMVEACTRGVGNARHWAQMVEHAGRDAAAQPLRTLGESLKAAATASDSEAVIDCLRVLLEQDGLPESARVRALRSRGRALYYFSRDREALTDFNRALQSAPDDAQTLAQRADVYRYMGRREEAFADLERALRIDPDSSWALGVRGMIYRDTSSLTRALADFDRALSLDPSLDWVRSRRSKVYKRLRRFPDALADLDRVLRSDPDHAEAIRTRGEIYLDTGNRQLALRALADLDRIISADPRNPYSLIQRGQLHRLLQQFDEALADFDRALVLSPEDPLPSSERGETHRQAGHLDQALADLDHALRLDPDNDWALANRGETHRLAGHLDLALADLNRAIEIDPDYAWALAGRGQVHRAAGRLDQALTDLDHALRLDPDNDWALANRGETHRLAGHLDLALADFDRAIQLEPDYAWALASRGQVHQAAGHLDQALADLDRAIQLDPDTAWALASRGQVHRAAGHLDQALADLNRAIEIDPGYIWAFAQRGFTHHAAGRSREALADFDRTVQLDPRPVWIAQRGFIHRLAGDLDQALTDLNRAIELDLEYAWAITQRGETHRLAGRLDQALADFDRAIELDPDDAWALGSRGQVHRAAGRLDQALADLDHALRLDPELTWAAAERQEIRSAGF